MAAEKKNTTRKATAKAEAPIVETTEQNATVSAANTVADTVEPIIEAAEKAAEDAVKDAPEGKVDEILNEQKIDAESVKEIEKALDAVSTEINPDITDAEISDEVSKELDEVAEIKEQVTALCNENTIAQVTNEEPEVAAEKIKGEIEKAEALKADISKKINEKPKKVTKPINVTNWWNGMSYDF